MKFKLNERSKRFLLKLKQEGLFGDFLKGLEKQIQKTTDADLKRQFKKSQKKKQIFLKQLKKDPEGTLDQLLKDLS